LQLRKVFFARGQDSGGDEQLTDVVGGSVLAEFVERFVGDRALLGGQSCEQTGGFAYP
jgi:hypothetical protein